MSIMSLSLSPHRHNEFDKSNVLLKTQQNASSPFDNLDSITQFLRCWPPYFLVPMALIGNTLSFIILARPAMYRMQVRIFLQFMAVFDTIAVLVGYFFPWLREEFHFMQHAAIPFTCKVERFFLFYGADVSTWILTALTMQRMMLIKYPLLGRKFSTKRNAKIVCISLTVVGIFKNWPAFVTMGVDDESDCIVHMNLTFFSSYEMYARPWISLSLYYIIPALLIIISNFYIIRALSNGSVIRLRTRTNSTPNTSSDPPDTKAQLITEMADVLEDPDKSNKTKTFLIKTKKQNGTLKSRSDRERRSIHVMTIVVTIVFLVLVTPSIILWTTTSLKRDPMDKYLRNFLFAIGDCLVIIHHSTNFILYAITGQRYRQEMIKMILCRR